MTTHLRTFYRLALDLIIAGLALALLACLSGCYGAAVDTRDIDADEVTITTHTPWSQTTITAKGWRSRVKAQAAESEHFPAAQPSKSP